MDSPDDAIAAAEAPCLWSHASDGPMRWLSSREHDHLLDIARNLFRCPSAAVFLEGIANAAGDAASFGHHVARSRGPFVVEDAERDPRFAENVMVRAYPHVRYFVGTAVRLGCGQLVGTLAVMDYIARERPRNSELAALESLAVLTGGFVEAAMLEALGPGQTAHLAMLVEHARPAVLTIDLDGRITGANRTAQRLLRAPLPSLVGHPADDHVIGWRALLRDGDRTGIGAGEGPIRTLLVEVVTADLGIVPALASLSTWIVEGVPAHRLLLDALP